MIDLYMVYSFIKRLATPFSEWDAFKAGIIDEKGNILKKINQRSADEKSNFTKFDLLVLKIKRLLEKIPGGNTRIASYAAALYLIKEQNGFTKEFNFEPNLFLEDTSIITYVTETVNQEMNEDEGGPTNSVGSGAIAGMGVGPDGEPGVSKKAQKAHQKRALMTFRRFYNKGLDEDDAQPSIPAKSLTVQKKLKKHPRKTIDLTTNVD